MNVEIDGSFEFSNSDTEKATVVHTESVFVCDYPDSENISRRSNTLNVPPFDWLTAWNFDHVIIT